MLPTRIALLTSLSLGLACAPRAPIPEPGGATFGAGMPIEVKTYGSLREMYEKGATRPVVSLPSLGNDPNRVGIGRLSGLRGEIAILPGETWVAHRSDDGASVGRQLGNADETAAFLATSVVRNWQPIPLSQDVSFAELPNAIQELAQRAGLNPDRPFPLLIEGALANLSFHVVDGRAFPSGVKISPQELMVSAAKNKYSSVEGTLVGFFGKHGHPELLEPDSRLHLHVVVPSKNQMGHVDHVDLPRGATVRVPLP